MITHKQIDEADKATLAKFYKDEVGYDPFEAPNDWTEQEIRDILHERADELKPGEKIVLTKSTELKAGDTIMFGPYDCRRTVIKALALVANPHPSLAKASPTCVEVTTAEDTKVLFTINNENVKVVK